MFIFLHSIKTIIRTIRREVFECSNNIRILKVARIRIRIVIFEKNYSNIRIIRIFVTTLIFTLRSSLRAAMTTGRTGWLVTTTTTGGTELSLPTSAGSWWTTGLVWTFPARTRRAAISASVRSTSPASPSVYGQSCTGTGAGSGTPLSGEGTVTTLNSSKGRDQNQF